MLTRILSLGNIMVASSAVRRGPYWHLLEICFHSPKYTRHVEAILIGVSERLGLTSFSALFEAYASQIAYSIRQARLDFLRLPPHLLGYQERKDCAEAAFRAFTPTNVLAGGSNAEAVVHGQKLFANHCRVIQKSMADGFRDCFGEIIGYQIVSWIDEGLPTEQLDKSMEDKVKSVDGLGDFDDLLRQHADGIVTAILRTLEDQDFSQEGTIVQALRAAESSGKAAQTFQSMTRYRKLDDFETHSPNLPFYCIATVLKALAWFGARVPETEDKATSYHVLHELFADLQHSPFVNEQIRVLNAITLWVAVHRDDFEELTLLHTLIHGATSLLTQSDLVRAAQSILEWAFNCYRKLGQKDQCFPDILIRICCMADDYAADAEDMTVATMGNDLVRWIDNQALALCKNMTLRNQVVKALPAWSHQPSPELTQIYEDITAESLSAVLGNNRISSNKFRLVRRLRDLAMDQQYDEEMFSKTDFWRLKECIPPAEQLQADDIDAFASLLVINKGHIHSFWGEQSTSQSVRTRHRGGQKKTSSSSERGDTPQHAIVLSLLAMLDGNATTHTHVAYRTLRSLMSVLASDIPQWQTWPSESREELRYLQTYPRTPGTRPLRNISELTSESFQDTSKGFPEWIAMITTLLSDILAGQDSFYAQLTSILQSDVTFAEQMLPVLVHTVLQTDMPKEKTKTKTVSYRLLLSNYFTSLLTSETVSDNCIRSIVDIVLHLRYFRGPNGTDALSRDKWLDVDFTLLARNAITYGAYTTALLFLELAAEYRGSSDTDDAAAEQILFDIYSHIDEPDGFYGIKTKDLSQFLIKRFHHEKQWEKAFRFHGAALEAGNAGYTEAEGLIQSFHSFGFNHLAIDTLQSCNIQTGPTFGQSGMSYRSGWRAGTWDLPDQTDQPVPGANLYLALRAIHRERDPDVIDNVIGRALHEEMGRLRVLGAENLAEIREVTRNLMCISQVTKWRHSTIQTRLQRKHIDPKEWIEFINIDPGFK
jgi:ataxia telangiectasia mutated family protein